MTLGGLIDAAGCSKVTLMAHDWGAVIAWHFAMHQIRKIDQLVICNVPHPGPAAAAMSWAQLKKSWYIFFFQLPRLPERMLLKSAGMGDMIQTTAAAPNNFSEAVVALYNENGGRKENVTAMINYYRGLVRGGGMRRQKRLGLPIISVPTLMEPPAPKNEINPPTVSPSVTPILTELSAILDWKYPSPFFN